MKANKDVLKKAVEVVSRFVPKGHVHLENITRIWLHTDGDELVVSATDLDTWCHVRVPAEDGGINILFDPKILKNILTKAKDTVTEIIEKEERWFSINGKYSILGYDAEDFPAPKMPGPEVGEIELTPDIIRKVFIAPPKDDKRSHVLHYAFYPDGRIVSTDGSRLHEYRMPRMPWDNGIMVSKAVLSSVCAIAKDGFTLSFAPEQNGDDDENGFAVIRAGATEVITPTQRTEHVTTDKDEETGEVTNNITRNFPDTEKIWKDVLERSDSLTVTVKKQDLADAVEQAKAIHEDGYRACQFQINGSLDVSYTNPNIGEYVSAGNIPLIEGGFADPVDVALNTDFVLQALKACGTEEVDISVDNEERPVGFFPVGNDSFRAVVMPMRI